MNNIPEVKLGVVAVSRDCFPITLSQSRRAAVCKACGEKGLEVLRGPDHRGERAGHAEGRGGSEGRGLQRPDGVFGQLRP